MKARQSGSSETYREQHHTLKGWAGLWDIHSDTLRSWLVEDGCWLDAGSRSRNHRRIPDSVAKRIYEKRLKSSRPNLGFGANK